MTVTVYSKPACVQCDQTKRRLAKVGVTYQEIDMTEDPAIMESLREQGFSAAPVVVAGDDSWAGFRPDKIKNLVRALSGAPAAAVA